MKALRNLMLIIALGSIGFSADTVAAPKSTGVVILHCLAFAGDPGHLTSKVIATSSSSNAPVIQQNSDCAQALADLFDIGYKIIDTQGTNSGIIYTLTN